MKVDIRIDERYENKSHSVFDYLKYTLDDKKLDVVEYLYTFQEEI